ncbi:MAG: DEAD/DEAH box helicase [Congregibacter sp.]
MSFEQLGLAPAIVRAAQERGYDKPSAVQAEAIPRILNGEDLVAAAQTGTGKTGAFVLPILQRLAVVGQPRSRQVRALILTPTRELAAQVHDSVVAYGTHLTLRSTTVYGGVKIGPQISKLAKGIDIVVATPGRLLDLIRQRAVDLSALEVLVLDEADRMLDMGFIHDIRRIIISLPKDRQTLMFSATFSKEILDMAKQYLVNPSRVQIAAPNSTADNVDQAVYPVEKTRKADLLVHLLREYAWPQVLVFTRTKHGANRLSQRLSKEGFSSAPIHGNKSQNARQRALDDFKAGRLQVLVATDIAARGLDISQLPDVVNFDLPAVAEDYVHRIGRTGRAGASGSSHSLLSPDEVGLLKAIERLLKTKIPRIDTPGFEPGDMPDDAPAPKPGGRRPQSRQGKAGGGRQDDKGGSPGGRGRRRRRAGTARGQGGQTRSSSGSARSANAA